MAYTSMEQGLETLMLACLKTQRQQVDVFHIDHL